ncbi:CobQ/CobB/MinD/ParA nucleotide binding domain protein [Microbacterium hydrocarbonoxydans]|uniref:CobQ/CobB/MinD/ParA nucleotide binding domain protein n=1 Tax=Microbacterium hydrocarbonoxydans TaxID=273678 RepID=A0A0M2HXB2_9MICO|nr:ParA family protein [Microbacterium hydrocarbonoxydans]KJL49565.1 CobQ/CobB/MinD/ParA nucleotide binding domain protein [Microbacterium hydrocarbonoxydans]
MTEHLKALLAERSEPVRLTVGNLKGGTGKSTTAVEIALTLARFSDLPVMLVDADSINGTTFEWSELAGEEWPSEINVHYWPSINLAKRVRDSGHTGHLVIDTGPGDAGILRQALSVTDYLVTPITASPAEAVRIKPTLEAAAEIGVSHPLELSVLFTRVKPNTVSLREAKEAIANVGLDVLPTDVPFVLLYSQAFGTVPDDLGVFPQVLTEILEGGDDE